MGAIILALAPLIIKVGGFLIDLFVTGVQAKADKKTALQAWIDAHKNDVNTSASEHDDFNKQVDDLKKDQGQ